MPARGNTSTRAAPCRTSASRLGGPASWQKNETIRRAINIDAGVVQKPHILSFQGREPNYPHAPLQALAMAA